MAKKQKKIKTGDKTIDALYNAVRDYVEKIRNLIYGFYQEITEKLSKGYHPPKAEKKRQ